MLPNFGSVAFFNEKFTILRMRCSTEYAFTRLIFYFVNTVFKVFIGDGSINCLFFARPPLTDYLDEQQKPYTKWDNFFDSLLLSNKSIGTHFYISPVDESLASALDKDYNSGDISTMQKMLLGFTNTMNAEAPHVINTAFRDYKTLDLSKSNNLIDKAIFFTLK